MSETTPVPYIVHSQCLTNVLMALRMMHGLQWMIGNTAYEKRCPTHHPSSYSWQSTFTSLVASSAPRWFSISKVRAHRKRRETRWLPESPYGRWVTAPRPEPHLLWSDPAFCHPSSWKRAHPDSHRDPQGLCLLHLRVFLLFHFNSAYRELHH